MNRLNWCDPFTTREKWAMRIYWGIRDDSGCRVYVENVCGNQPLDPRFDLRRHSPAGFEWGYGGSGPAQLALALCADALGDDEQAENVYQEYKRCVVALIESDDWTLTVADVLAVIMDIEEERCQ